MKHILCSTIDLSNANTGKLSSLSEIHIEYKKAVEYFIDKLWNGHVPTFHPEKQKYELSNYVSNINFKPENTILSARMIKSATTQAIGIVKSKTEKLRKTQFIIKKKQKEGKNTNKLQRIYDKKLYKLRKPEVKHCDMELNSNNIEVSFTNNTSFDGVIILKSLFSTRSKPIIIPFKSHKHLNLLRKEGTQLAGMLVSNDKVYIRYEIEKDDKIEGNILGADQGIVTAVTLSDGQITTSCCHGHNLQSIQKKLSRKKKGSNGFKRVQEHRKNYINWSIKQLNLNNTQELRVEKLRNVGKGTRKSRYIQAWTYREINTAINKLCLNNGVRLVEQSNAFRSQRCNDCGFVHKTNRKAKLFECKRCGHTNDADLNAALNIRDDLSPIPVGFWRLKKNRSDGFYWMKDGVFDLTGHEFTVRDVKET